MIRLINCLAMRKIAKLLAICAVIFIISGAAMSAENSAKADVFYYQDAIPAERSASYSVSSLDQQLVFSASAGTSTEDLSFKLYTVAAKDEIKANYNFGDDLLPASDLYSLTIGTTSQDVIAGFKPKVALKFPDGNRLYNIYLWDKLSNGFIKIDSQKDLKNQLASLAINDYGELTFALFEEKAAEGHASWYVNPRYKKELMAASTQFARGAKVKVTNLSNSKSVIVTIKDYGPDPFLHPDRVIDLNKVAFTKIASTRAGVIDVRVEPLFPATSTASPPSNLPTGQAGSPLRKGGE